MVGGNLLVLPVATFVLVISPYIFRMTRATMIEELESRLRGDGGS